MNGLKASKTVVFISFLLAYATASQVVRQSPQPPGSQQQLGLIIPMRDGVHLAADVSLPRAHGRWPTVLVRTPYNRKAGAARSFRIFLTRGYALVVEDVRGRFASQGVFGLTEQEASDGYDTINWICAQPWSNGQVVMAGASYLGMAQWWAAVAANPHLVAISPMASGDDEYLDRFYSPGGAMKLGQRLLWLAQNFTPPSQVRLRFAQFIYHLPLRNADVSATGVMLPEWRSAIDHPSYDAYWRTLSIREQLQHVNVPVLSLGGWFDNFVESDLDAFSRLSRAGKTVETWIGPWAHNPAIKFPTRDFGPSATIGIRLRQVQWFDRWLNKTSRQPVAATPPLLRIFVMGPNVWRDEHEWPLARTRYTRLYIASAGHANSVSGDGVLEWEAPHERGSDGFTYDPKNPVPTIGGPICCDSRVLPPGPLDQTPVESRNDVLVYTSPALRHNIEVTGPVRVDLYVSTSANDTDFTAKLVDVDLNGRPLIVTDGIQRLRYRLSLDHPVFVKRNRAYQISVDAGVTSYVFYAGHRIRLEVSSSNFPRFDRNLNSAHANADQVKTTKARQSVFYGERYPSAIILPIIPEANELRRQAQTSHREFTRSFSKGVISSPDAAIPNRVQARIWSSWPSSAASAAP